MSAGAISRRARRFLLASACFLVAWQAGALAGISYRTAVVLGLLGFVLHAVFGKAYSLVPAYFDRELAIERAPTVQFPLTVVGTLCLALGAAHPKEIQYDVRLRVSVGRYVLAGGQSQPDHPGVIRLEHRRVCRPVERGMFGHRRRIEARTRLELLPDRVRGGPRPAFLPPGSVVCLAHSPNRIEQYADST
jgi:hypothetical protein